MRHTPISQARRLKAVLPALALVLGLASGARAAAPAAPGAGDAIGRTPPRLSYLTGEVSFWRPGAQDWAPAQPNTPLAPGDEVYTGNGGNVELQVGGRAFVRAWGDTQMGLVNLEPDFLQIKVTSGHASLDLRSVDAGRTVELDTPHGAFTIEHPGYYRVDVAPERTSFIARRAGRATLTSASGQAVAVAPSEEVVLEGAPTPAVQSYVAPDLDVWDRWNYARTDQLLDSVSARYVASNVYGVDDLDHYGTWRVVPTYGAVWVPESAPAGWAPYSTGRWVWDPYYGWTWVDTAPWGWAPYHYGRWVFVSGLWAWAPGPVVARAVYAPALVAFFGAPGIRVSVSAPVVSWVALGWGEPLIPWWGPAGFVGRVWWGGWGGPRVINNVVISRTTVVNVTSVTVYRNVSVQNAVVAVPHDHFGRRPTQEARVAGVDVRRLEPVRGALRVTPEASSFVAAGGRGVRPPEAALSRQVVATRPPAGRRPAPHGEADRAVPSVRVPAPKIVAAPKPTAAPGRPPFGTSPLERPRAAHPPGLETPQPPEAGTPRTPHGATTRTEPERPAPRERGRGPEATPPPAREQGRELEATPPAPRERGRGPEPTPPAPRERARGPEPTPAAPRERIQGPDASTPGRPGPRGPQPAPPMSRERAAAPEPKPPAQHSGPQPESARPPRGVAPPAEPLRGPGRVESPRPSVGQLPGEPANRLFPGRGEGSRDRDPGRPGDRDSRER